MVNPPPSEYHRARSVGSTQLDTLINSLTLDQLRSAAYSISADGKPISARSRADVSGYLLDSGRSPKELARLLLRIEASIPHKHCVIASFNGSAPNLSDLRPPQPLGNDSGGFVLDYLSSSPVVALTVSHQVSVKEWVAESAEVKRIKTTHLRHPIQVRIYEAESMVVFSFPGFNQGDGVNRTDRLGYDSLITSLMRILEQTTGIKFAPMPVRRALNLLNEGSSSRVRIVATDIDSAFGRLRLTSSDTDRSVADILEGFLKPHLPQRAPRTSGAEIRRAVERAIESAAANSILCWWTEEQVVTRINFWDHAAELLFVWHDTAKSFYVVETITKLLSGIARTLSIGRDSAWAALINTPPGVVLTPATFGSVNGLESAASREILVRGLKSGLLETVFRLKLPVGESLEESDNIWITAASELQKVFRTAGGLEIDGRVPNSIEVGFRRAVAETK